MKTLTPFTRTKIATILAAFAISGATLSVATAYQEGGAYVPCDFPHGWNSTDASHALEGTPDGDGHRCWAPGRPTALLPSTIWGPRWRNDAGSRPYDRARQP